MATAYTPEELTKLFQSAFDLAGWTALLHRLFGARELLATPQRIDEKTDEKGYYLGQIATTDDFFIGLFYYEITSGSVIHRRVGLRNLVRSFINPNWGDFDAGLVVFDSGDRWRLSFVCDLKGESTAPTRYTYLFGESDHLYSTPVARFAALQQQPISFARIREAFSVESLTKEFYTDLFAWYQWALSPEAGVYFPNDTSTPSDDFEDLDTKIIRLLARLIFVWFIKQKGLVPESFFDANELRSILRDFDPQSQEQGAYYNAILQNLFFATLNRAIEDQEGPRRFAQRKGQRDLKNLYRYQELFAMEPEEAVGLFSQVPFLNGGLFECLDKTTTIDGVEMAFHLDGFSRSDKKFPNGRYRQRAFIPNLLFFHPQKGLLSILKRYNFTIEENTPSDQQVALDPELLGRVFENLLGAYNPETQETARKQSGSFYTPREIVAYMVDECLMAHLEATTLASLAEIERLFADDFSDDASQVEFYGQCMESLKRLKVFDPACGSGAFPMGLLDRLFDLHQKLAPSGSKSPYDLKLSIIENCIYGADIQTIATQISKLRVFISLVCDCEADDTQPNRGIPTLPNLETKFVAADSLVALRRRRPEDEHLFTRREDDPLVVAKGRLHAIRHQHFQSKTVAEKKRLRDQDAQVRAELLALLAENDMFAPEDAHQMAEWNPYDQNAVSPFFDPEWMFGLAGGFDIVIGNPPYIQLQKNDGQLAKRYGQCGFSTFARTGDIYTLFYERGWQLLREGGHLCYITSNKWMRAAYGQKTRAFLAERTNPMTLIDFAGVRIFESATVDTNILLLAKTPNRRATTSVALSAQRTPPIANLRDLVRGQGVECDFSSADGWVILSPIEQRIRRKIEAVGVPLKEWDVRINYGIKTGCNEAFVISSAQREGILARCADDAERARTDALIRPLLRGRDIRPYGYEWAGLYIIATFPSRNYNIDHYPAVKKHLLSFGKERLEQTGEIRKINGEVIKSRKKTNNKWFETQDSISYWGDFGQPKIVWKRVGSILRFAFDGRGYFGLDSTCFLTGNHIEYVCCVLNSSMGHYLLRDAPKTGTGDLLVSVQAVEPIRIPYDPQCEKELLDLFRLQLANPSDLIESRIDKLVFFLYGLSPDEEEYVKKQQ